MINGNNEKKFAFDRKFWFKLFLSIIFTATLLYILFKNISIKELERLISKADIKFIIMAFLSYLTCYFFRAIRFKSFLIDDSGRLPVLFQIHAVHNMLNQLLPANLGELSYIYMLKSNAKIRLVEGTSCLLLARFFDVLVVISLFLISCLLIPNKTLFSLKIAVIVTAGLMIGLIIAYLIILRLFQTKWMLSEKSTFISKVINKIKYGFNEIVETITNLNTFKRLFIGILASLIAMNCVYLFYFFTMKAIGINIHYMEIMFVASFLVPQLLIPVKGVAGFGTHEASWAIGFIVLGYNKEIAILSGFAIHLLILIFASFIGLQGILSLKLFFKPSSKVNIKS